MLTIKGRKSSLKMPAALKYAALNPAGTVPALGNDAPDCCYLDRYYPNPTDPPARRGHAMVSCNELRVL